MDFACLILSLYLLIVTTIDNFSLFHLYYINVNFTSLLMTIHVESIAPALLPFWGEDKTLLSKSHPILLLFPIWNTY